MRRAQVRKQIVCPECHRVLEFVPVPATAAEDVNLLDDEEVEDTATVGPDDDGIELIVEEGPVCPRCAAT